MDIFFYFLAQFGGAVLAFLSVDWIRETLITVQLNRSAELGYPSARADIESQFASLTTTFFEGTLEITLLLEGLLTFLFVFTVISVVRNEKLRDKAGFIIGTVLFVVTAMAFQITGGSFHPFRSLIPAIFEGGEASLNVWVYIVAPFGGAILASIVYAVMEGLNSGKSAKSTSSAAPKKTAKRRKSRK
jgi:glycerol uptake facilitator-like aquaporin